MSLHRYLYSAGLLLLLACSGCSKPKTEEELLLERANMYWEAARVFDLSTMYKLEAASLDGRLIPADMAKVLMSETRLIKYTLRNPKITGDTASIELSASLTMKEDAMGSGRGWDQAPRNEIWSKINGQWYRGRPKPTGTAAPPEGKPSAPSASAPDPGSVKPAPGVAPAGGPAPVATDAAK